MASYGNYETQAGPQYELSNTSNAPRGYAATPISTEDFLARVDYSKDQIRQLKGYVKEIGTLHQRALSSPDQSSVALDSQVSLTQANIRQIRDNVKFLEKEAAKDPSNPAKRSQAAQVKRDFTNELTAFQEEEVSFRKQYQDAQKRQWRIVNPDASEAELQEVANMEWGNEGVFATALKSNRSRDVSATLGSVQSRHKDIQQIEKTITELALMFEDLAQIVEVSEPMVQDVENNAIQTEEDMRDGNKHVDKAIDHARRRNRLKWWCLLVVVLIILGVALGVGLGVGLAKAASNTASH